MRVALSTKIIASSDRRFRTTTTGMTMRRSNSCFAGLLLAAATFTGCASGACDDVTFASGDLFVAQGCGAADGDGSRAAPFLTIQAALNKAGAGQTIAIATGTYAESLTSSKSVALSGGAGVVIAPPDGTPGLVATGGALTVRDLTVQGATLAGIAVSGIDATLINVTIKDSKRGKENGLPVGGHGFQAIGGAKVRLENVVIKDNTGTGVLAQGTGSVTIIDPSFMTDPNASAGGGVGKAGIIDPSFDTGAGAKIANNYGGGVAIIDPSFSPAKTDDPTGIIDPSFSTGGLQVKGNRTFGIALFGATAKIAATAIYDTTKHTGEDFADGLLVTNTAASPTLDVALSGNSIVANNGRAGVLLASGTDAKNALRGTIDADISGNALGGAWSQGTAAELHVGAKSMFSGNSVVGIGATGGSLLDVAAATVQDTKKVAWQAGGGDDAAIGDGIGLFDGARATLNGTKLTNNARAGLIIDKAASAGGAPDVTATAVSVTGGSFGVVLNKGTSGGDKLVGGGVTVGADVKTALLKDADFAVQRSACDASNGKSDCTPSKPALKSK